MKEMPAEVENCLGMVDAWLVVARRRNGAQFVAASHGHGKRALPM